MITTLQAIEAEEGLAGACLIEPAKIDAVTTIVDSSMFSDAALGRLWDALVDLRDAGQGIDAALIRAELQRRGHYNDSGINAARLAELLTREPHPHHAMDYAKRIRSAYHRRRGFELLSDAAAAMNDPTQEPGETFSHVAAGIDRMTATSVADAVSTLADAVESYRAELDRPRDDHRAVRTGLDALDHRTLGGLMPGEVCVLAARPGCGKSSMAWQISLHAAQSGRAVLYVSLEMTAIELIGRTMAGMTSASIQRLRSGRLEPDQRDEIDAALMEIRDYPLTIADPPRATMKQVRGLARMERATRGLDLLVVDYIGLLDHPNRTLKRFEQVSQISREIKQLAKELQVPILALSQLNRDADGRKPLLSHLRESGSIEQDADQVVFLHPDDPREMDRFKLIVAKNRHGMAGELDITFDASRTRFADTDFAWRG